MESDSQIIEAIKNGDNASALSFLYKRTLKKVRGYIIKNNGTREEADDIFQEAIVIFFLKVREGQFHEGNSIDGFIFTIARNFWINRVRRQTLHKQYEEYLASEDVLPERDHLSHILDREKSAILQKLFAQLEENCRKILKYSLYERLSMKEICVKMGHKNENVSKAQHYRCKQYLVRLVRENKNVLDALRS